MSSIYLTKIGSLMDNSSTTLFCDVWITQYSEGTLLLVLQNKTNILQIVGIMFICIVFSTFFARFSAWKILIFFSIFYVDFFRNHFVYQCIEKNFPLQQLLIYWTVLNHVRISLSYKYSVWRWSVKNFKLIL